MEKLTLWDRISIWWSRNIKNRIYWLKCRLFKKYNLVRIRSLPCTWTDRDAVLVHAMFQVLSDFMEKEKPGERTDWSWNEEHAHAWKEMNELYDWWHNVYLKFDPWEKRGDAAPEVDQPALISEEIESGFYKTDFEWSSKEAEESWHADMDSRQKLEDEMEAVLEANCIRLIKIRGYLWT